ncbi:MAG: beta-propeller domain-containing protein [Ruminococcus sp.]|nr:beta-propeller domain-containing protein [Ruminococcus sp.]
MRRTRYIKRMEANNKVPDKLLPKRIKDMLDEHAMPNAVITDTRKEEIKLSRNSFTAARLFAFAAVIALLVGGIAFVRYSQTHFIKTYPKEQPSNAADTNGLEGIRGTTYNGLFNALKNNKQNKEKTTVQTDYIYSKVLDVSRKDGEIDYSLDSYLQALRLYQITGNAISYDSLNIYANGNDVSVTDHTDSYTTQLEYGDYLLRATAGENGDLPTLYSYKLKDGKAEKLDYDFFAESALMNSIIDKEICAQYEYEPAPLICDLSISGDTLKVFFGFNLPARKNDKTYFLDYCGFTLYDISDMENIRLIGEYEQPGTMTGLRETGGELFIVSQYTQGSSLIEPDERYSEDNTDFIPVRYINGEKQLFPEGDMYIVARNKVPSMMIVSSFDEESDCSLISSKLIQSESKYCYIGEENIYLTGISNMVGDHDGEGNFTIKISNDDGVLDIAKTAYLDMPYTNYAAEEYNGRLYLAWYEESTREGQSDRFITDDGMEYETTNYTVYEKAFDEELEEISSVSRDFDGISLYMFFTFTVYHGRVDVYYSPIYSEQIDDPEHPITTELAYAGSLSVLAPEQSIDIEWDTFVRGANRKDGLAGDLIVRVDYENVPNELGEEYSGNKMVLQVLDLAKYRHEHLSDEINGTQFNIADPDLISTMELAENEACVEEREQYTDTYEHMTYADKNSYCAVIVLSEETNYSIDGSWSDDPVNVQKERIVGIKYDLVSGKITKVFDEKLMRDIRRGAYPIELYPYTDKPEADIPEEELSAERYELKNIYIKDGYAYVFTDKGVLSYSFGE